MSPSSSTADRKERPPRSFWFDPRFAIGLVLVIVSVLGVVFLVSTADNTVQVYAARAPLSAGDRIDADDLVAQAVRLGPLTSKYLGKNELPAEGLIVTKTVAQGELIPASAVGSVAGTRVASVVIRANSQLPRSITAGSVVDIWAAKKTDNRLYGPPSVLVSSATVVRVIEGEGVIAGGSAPSVELLVTRAKTARVLEAIANDDALSLVPVNLPIASLARG